MIAPQKMDSFTASPDILPELCKQRSEVIRMIPDVKRTLALRSFEDAIFQVGLGDHEWGPEIENTALTDSFYRGRFEKKVITPNGARLLKKMLHAGLVLQNRKSSPKETPELDAYIESDEELIAKSNEIRQQRHEAKLVEKARWHALETRAAHLAKHPEDATPDEIGKQLIDRVFIHKMGYGRGGEISLAGMRCCKDVQPRLSNSGKTRYTDVSVYWFDTAGCRHGDVEVKRPPNRRNDPERNWGLGRE